MPDRCCRNCASLNVMWIGGTAGFKCLDCGTANAYDGPRQSVSFTSVTNHSDKGVEERPMPNPTQEQIDSPEFEAVWQAIKTWDINVPESYNGYCGATGSHVAPILNALATVSDQRVKELEEAREALALLVELKDGPRDDHYRAMKDRAWHRARVALSTLRGEQR